MKITPNSHMYRDYLKIKKCILNTMNEPEHYDVILEMITLFEQKWKDGGLRLFNLSLASLRYHWKIQTGELSSDL